MTRLLHPRYWGAHLAMLVAVAIAVGLGFWQLGAWQDKREAATVDLTTGRPVPLDGVIGGDDPFPGESVGQPVSFSGTWMDAATTYIGDRDDDGRVGYWVVTPVEVAGTRSAMPVVRGWTATPEAAPVSGTAELTGWLQPGEGSGLPDDDPRDDVLPELRIPSLVDRVDTDLYSAYVISERPDGDLNAVHPSEAPVVGRTTALRNFLYAIEWWIFGLFALVVWGRWCRDTLHPADPEAAPGEGGGADGDERDDLPDGSPGPERSKQPVEGSIGSGV